MSPIHYPEERASYNGLRPVNVCRLCCLGSGAWSLSGLQQNKGGLGAALRVHAGTALPMGLRLLDHAVALGQLSGQANARRQGPFHPAHKSVTGVLASEVQVLVQT